MGASTGLLARMLLLQAFTVGLIGYGIGVGLTALFTGGALALQIYAGGQRFSAEAVVPSPMPTLVRLLLT